MNSCAFCGRANESGSRFCIDCGKPLTPSAARVVPAATPVPNSPIQLPSAVSAGARAMAMAGGSSGSGIPATRVSPPEMTASCPHCAHPVDASLPFCGRCGKRTGLGRGASGAACPSCGGGVQPGVDFFCPRCGTRVGDGPVPGVRDGRTMVLSPSARAAGPRIVRIDDAGEVTHTFTIERGEAVVGRSDADIQFPDDVYMSPVHAQFAVRDGELWLRDLGSRNGSWAFLDGPARLTDGDVILVGSQMFRFRRLGYPGPHPPEADATRRMGSLTPTADVAVLAQLRSDGSVRDTYHLSPGRNIIIGRESGDWVFPYDPTMSGRHAEIRSEDNEFIVQDAGSRNGVALAVRGDRVVKKGQRVLLGDQLLRVESV